MPESPLLDFVALVAPIPGNDPAGTAVPYEVRHEMNEARKEVDPNDFDLDDPRRPEKAKKSDWARIEELATETLTTVSKDPELAARLTEALTQLHGFTGLRDGLRLLRELVEQAWDRLYPPLENRDLEVRATAFFWLDDPDMGVRFPYTLRTVPLFGKPQGRRYGFVDWQQLKASTDPTAKEELSSALQATPPEHWERVARELSECLQELDLLSRLIAEKLGPIAPTLANLDRALKENQGLVRQITPAPRQETSAETHILPEGVDGAPVGSPRGGVPRTRAEAYEQLRQALSVLRNLEPHSPVPYLVERAVQLGSLPFPKLIRELIRDGNILNELDRELGIKGQDPTATPASGQQEG